MCDVCGNMDLLPHFCVSGELSKKEFANQLNSAGSEEVSDRAEGCLI